MIFWVLDHLRGGFDLGNPILMSELNENDCFKANYWSEVRMYEGLCRKTWKFITKIDDFGVLDHFRGGFDLGNPILMSELNENDYFKAKYSSEVRICEGFCRKTCFI